MKLWKILLATLIATLLVCGCVAMADETHTHEKYVVSTETKGPIKAAQGCIYYVEVKRACANCDWTETDTSDSYTDNHAFGEADYHEATCTKASYRVYTCTVCGYVKTEEGNTAALEHDYKWVWTKNPTCTEKGYQKLTCSRCGDVKQEAEIATVSHTWSQNVLSAATCTEDGKANTKCSVCGTIQEASEYTLNATGHEQVETVNITAADCAANGHTLVWYNKCKACGEVTYEQKKTAYNVAVSERENGCGVEGYSAHMICGICSAANGKEIYPALTHDYTIQVSHTPATCENPGVRVMQCKVRNVNGAYCDDTIEEVVPALGHTHSDYWTVKVAATCTEEGIEENLCKTCGLDAQYRSIEAKGHKFYSAAQIIADNSKAYAAPFEAPECENDGYAYAKCANGCAADKYTVLPALGHSWSAWDVADYDCENGTVGTRVCTRSNCDAEDEKVFVEPAGHKWVVTAGEEATCESAGVVNRECSVSGCDAKQYNVYVPATGHGESKIVSEVAPACGVAGSVTKECEDCGKTYTESVAALKHIYEWVTTKEASMSGDGEKAFKCNLCGDVAETETIKYHKYYYNNTMTSFGPTTKELVGGSDWYRVTPIDTTVDGVYTYDLIASNKYVVGTVTIVVSNGALTVSYDTYYTVDVNDEMLLIYASKADLAEGKAVTANVGSAINLAETFGADAKIIVSLVLTGDYDAAAAGVSYMDADDAEIAAMIANID